MPSINLKSSATLGTGRTSSHREMFDRREDKEVRRASKKVKLDPMIDEDSGDEEGYIIPLADVTKPPRVSQTRQSRASDVHSVADDTEAVSLLVTVAPASVGSALRKSADGSVAAPKMLPKRNKSSKVKKSPF